MPGKPDLRTRAPRRRDDAAWPVVLSAVLLAGAVAAAVSAAMLRFAPVDGPRIASVRLGEMTAAYAVKAARGERRLPLPWRATPVPGAQPLRPPSRGLPRGTTWCFCPPAPWPPGRPT